VAQPPRATSGEPLRVDRASWFDEEAPLGAAGFTAGGRIVRRALISWRTWVAAALVISAGLALWRARVPPRYDVTVVLRVSEGAGPAAASAADLGAGALRTYIEEVAFTTTRLLELMHRYPKAFADVDKDPASSLEDLRLQTTISISGNDFIEVRGPGDPPRSARISIEFRDADPQIAWNMAHDLGDLLIRSTLGGQRAALEREAAAAAAAITRIEAEIAELSRVHTDDSAQLLKTAQERWRAAEQKEVAARIALGEAAAHQALRFDVIDPGQRPARVGKTAPLLTDFLQTLGIMLLVGGLLGGAFDPRLLDAEDLAALGVPLLGRFPALPARRRAREGESAGPRV
jgi:hypothetical protein